MYDVSDLVVAITARGHVVDPLRLGTNNIKLAREWRRPVCGEWRVVDFDGPTEYWECVNII